MQHALCHRLQVFGLACFSPGFLQLCDCPGQHDAVLVSVYVFSLAADVKLRNFLIGRWTAAYKLLVFHHTQSALKAFFIHSFQSL